MARQALIVSAFLLFLNVSLVLCREDYQQYYSNHYSHHHHKSTPADSVSSTEAPVSLSEETSVSGSANDIEVKTTDEDVKQHEFSLFGLSSDVKGSEKPVLQRSSTYINYSYDQTVVITRIVIIVGAVAFFIIVLIVIICCRPACCSGRQTPGYIISDSTTQLIAQPQQFGPETPFMHSVHPAQQLPSYPPGYTLPPVQQQHHPPEQQLYQTPQVQQQYEYSPSQQHYHNPPTAPPPYSEKY